MRITNNMLIRNMMRNLNSNLNRMDKVQQQLSSGKKFQLPSDDPIGVSKSLKLHTDLSRIEQYKRNTDDAYSWMEATETSVREIGDVFQRVRELTVQAANGSNSESDLKKISEEIGQLKEHLITVGNTSYAGRSIFSGFKTNAPLLDEDGNYKLTSKESGTFTGGDFLKLNRQEVSEYNVGVSESVQVNTIGFRLFGKVNANYSTDSSSVDYDALNTGRFEDSEVIGYEIKGDQSQLDSSQGHKSYVIAVMDELKNAMDSDDSTIIDKSLERIDAIMEQTLSVRAEVGAKMNRLEMTQNKLESQTVNFTKLLSQNEDADMAEVIMNLKIEENVYRASLSAGAKIIQPTLVDFLR